MSFGVYVKNMALKSMNDMSGIDRRCVEPRLGFYWIVSFRTQGARKKRALGYGVKRLRRFRRCRQGFVAAPLPILIAKVKKTRFLYLTGN
jgi:hypothetical protein